VSRLVDAGVWQLSLRHKTCRHNPKGFRSVGTAETRLDREVSSARTAYHETAHLILKQANSAFSQPISPSRSFFSACSIHTHKHHPFTKPLPPPNYPIHNTNTPAPRSQLALPNASTGQPLYAHRDSINIQSTTPSQPVPQTVAPRPQYHPVRATCTLLLFPSRAALALARASPTAAHWDMYRPTPTTQTTLLG
jgi:hypothetical protein